MLFILMSNFLQRFKKLCQVVMTKISSRKIKAVKSYCRIIWHFISCQRTGPVVNGPGHFLSTDRATLVPIENDHNVENSYFGILHFICKFTIWTSWTFSAYVEQIILMINIIKSMIFDAYLNLCVKIGTFFLS